MRTATVLFVLLGAALLPGCYCSHLADRFEFDEDDAGTDGGPDARVPADAGTDATVEDGGMDAGPGDAGPDDGGSLDAGTDGGPDGGAVDAPIDSGPDAGPCGEYGQACCSEGTPCSSGECAGGLCAVFGGAYQTRAEGSVCAVGNPLSGGDCSCPSGFVSTQIGSERYESSSAAPQQIFFCTSPSDEMGDYRGTYRTQGGPPGCEGECVANPMTSDCTCPATAERQTQTVNTCFHTVSTCNGSVPPLTFGGSYWEIDHTVSGGFGCGPSQFPDGCIPNPETDRCTCPFGFMELRFETSARWVGTATTGICSTIMGVCVGGL